MHKDELSLEELSAAAGMTARNVRAYQTKGLIPPPARSGRRSVYGTEHLYRLRAIERARRRGASLSLIAAHLAAGRTLDDDTLIGWHPGTHDIAPLLVRLDIQRDTAAHRHVEELVKAGVFRAEGEGRRIYTGRELAEALTALQQLGLPLEAALGVAERALQAATPLAATIREAVADLDDEPPALRKHLGEVATCVMRHVISAGYLGETDPSADGGDQFDLDR